MSRLTMGNIIKAVLAILFSVFVAFYVLLIGLSAKNKKLIIEGAIYAVIFSIAFSLPGDSGAFAGVGSMAVSAVRTFMLRDIWLPRRNQNPKHVTVVQQSAPMHAYHPTAVPAQPVPAPPSFPGAQDDLSTSLTWVNAQAKQNKHRLPADTYVTILETCQMLDSAIDAERRQPSGDARFKYELEAMVREYLPSVLRGYLAIPPSMVGSRQPNGRTPNEELAEQLSLLQGQAEALHGTRHQQTSSDLTTTGNFLRERFGHHQPDGFDFGIK
ncbi:hypothetical protein ACTXL8_08885 [Glutamicibacter arilaitensis]|uniref:hypothetical protein n=1 Tax=Glutamicibacter arilaitensis TaxID=256701 RepID=UPI003FD0DB84